MKKILLVPDSFKGTMSSAEVCEILSGSISRFYPQTQIISIPVADGGEGSVDAYLAYMGGEKVSVTVKDLYMESMESFYGLVDDGATAIIEMAACAGLPLAGDDPHVEKTTTFGVGQLMADALGKGCKKLILGLGGSATNDFGTGAAAALGIRFLDKDGKEFVPVGENLTDVRRIDKSRMLPQLNDVEMIAMCDIDNPLYGKTGASYVFAPQKGADAGMVDYLDRQIRAISDTVIRELNIDVSGLPGSGAAGGMGGGAVAFLGAKLKMGIEAVLDTVGFDKLLEGADLVITGEGRLDQQSLRGKVVTGVARRAKKAGVPVLAIVGDIGDDIGAIYDEGVSGIFSINRMAVPFEEAKSRSKSDLSLTADNLMRFLSMLGYQGKQ
ncbi:MAG: glycerate kinase [Clostridiales Family XIII bacterium]|nr:glycerate kinase [Clostridiales Family XIII bacterium]